MIRQHLTTPAPAAGADGLTREETFAALLLLSHKIEACGASPALTAAVSLCGDILFATGNQWNPVRRYAVNNVRAALSDGAGQSAGGA